MYKIKKDIYSKLIGNLLCAGSSPARGTGYPDSLMGRAAEKLSLCLV